LHVPAADRPALHVRRGGFAAVLLRSPVTVFGLALVLGFALLALGGPLVSGYDPIAPVLADRLQGPSPTHLLGTDDTGRDVATRLAHGARVSLLMGVLAMAISAGVGVPLGLLAGYLGGWWDLVIMRLVDLLLTLPSIVLAIAIVSSLGAGVASVIIAVGITTIPAFARLAQAAALTLRHLEFVQAARALGASTPRILAQHVLPNALPPLIVQASLGVGTTILTAASLGFLGLGVQPPAAEWGAMLSRGRTYIASAPLLVAFPGLAIALLVLGCNLVGDGLRDALDPRLRTLTR
jgi:ABC-type dipeptide/oligopeptide/nickel transport system permease subunit